MTLLNVGRVQVWTYRRGPFEAGHRYWCGRTWGCRVLILRLPRFNLEFAWIDADQERAP